MICSACGESSLERLCSLGSIPLCDDFRELAVDSLGLPTFRLAPNLCPRCHHIELQEKPDCSSVYSRYLYRSRHSVDLSSHFSFYADSVTRFFEGLTGCRPKSVLDVGCNDGLLLDHFHKKIPNAVLHGLDPSPAINDVSKKIITHNVFFTEDYITSKQFSNTFDIVVCNNTLANISQVEQFFNLLGSCLNDSGLLVVETGYGPATFINSVWDMVNHEHYHYFSIEGLSLLARRCGLALVKAEIQKTKGGSIRAYFVKRQTQYVDYFEKINDLQGYESALFVNCDSFADSVQTRLDSARKHCELIKNSVSKIVHFGASAGTTVLVHSLGFSDLSGKIADDNRSRHGLYLPGTSAQVTGFDESCIDGETTVIIWSWRFAREIVNRHPAINKATEIIYGNTFRPMWR